MSIDRLPGHLTFVINRDHAVLDGNPQPTSDRLWDALPVGLRDHRPLRDAVDRAIETDTRVMVARMDIDGPRGHQVWLAHIAPVTAPGRFTVELTDITAPIESAMRSQQEGSLYLLGQFAHQIRNPLAGITGAIQVFGMETGPDDPKAEVMGMVLEESFRLNRLISDLVTLARDPDVQLEEVDVRAVVDELRGELSTQYAQVDIGVEGTASWRSDRQHLTRILKEVIVNGAESAGDGGQVIVRVSRPAISVSDSGPGIEPSSLDQIFEPLFSTRGRGIGLGLAIARRLAVLLGHSLQVTPPRDLAGATFTIERAPTYLRVQA